MSLETTAAELTAGSKRPALGLAIVAAGLIGACTLGQPGPQEREQRRRSVPIGSRLELLLSLPVPGNVWSLYFQDGAPVRFGQIDLNRPYCELYLDGAKGDDWIVQADTFIVTATRSDEREVAQLLPARSFTLAALRETAEYETVLVLHSPSQPEVRELRCRVEAEAGFATYPTLGVIRHALGEFFRLRLVEGDTASSKSQSA